jgi:hypothetical protein
MADYIISSVGFVYSVVLATANYLNTKIIRKIGDYIRELEGSDLHDMVKIDERPYQHVEKIVQDSM